ncbi:MAG: outer membrane lipoprotein-sorting protein [Bdellovibrionales bacterium]|nr:outer membrane lipoprotein-sorting protein [Bdellovibrionales bacterium]
MKKTLLVFLLCNPLWAADPTAVVKKIEGFLAPAKSKFSYAFVNHRTDGTTMNYEVKFQMKDSNHSHGYFIKPEREKGREVLRLEDDLWTYMPNVGKAVHIADRDSFAGGDFSNADILRVDWTSKYSVTLLKALTSQDIYELKAKSNDAAYAKMRLWVDKKSEMPVQQKFYDTQGTLLKRLSYGEVKKFGKIERPSYLLMENVITRQKSELRVLSMESPADVKDSRFRVDNLGK